MQNDFAILCHILSNVPHTPYDMDGERSSKLGMRLVSRLFDRAVCDDASWSSRDRENVDRSLTFEHNYAKRKGEDFTLPRGTCSYVARAMLSKSMCCLSNALYDLKHVTFCLGQDEQPHETVARLPRIPDQIHAACNTVERLLRLHEAYVAASHLPYTWTESVRILLADTPALPSKSCVDCAYHPRVFKLACESLGALAFYAKVTHNFTPRLQKSLAAHPLVKACYVVCSTSTADPSLASPMVCTPPFHTPTLHISTYLCIHTGTSRATATASHKYI